MVDLNLNPENSITNIRAFGDDPDKVIPLVQAFIEGMQCDGLLAACCKHFPGDGVDNRDQHMVTSVNSLPLSQWRELYGRVWKSAFDAGAMSVMAGHISLPDYQNCQDDVDSAMPATLSKELQIDLLRDELGFEGVLVSDAFPMTGFTSRLPEDQLAVTNVQNGSDSVLFADPVKDYKRLCDALADGRLSETRVNESVRRILTMKAALGLHKDCFGTVPSDEEYAEHEALAEKYAAESVCVLRENKAAVPVKKEEIRKVLTISLVRQGNMIPNLDFETEEQVIGALKQLAESGTTILYVGHQMERMEELCNRFCLLEKGNVLVTGTKEELLLGKTERKTLKQLWKEQKGRTPEKE